MAGLDSGGKLCSAGFWFQEAGLICARTFFFYQGNSCSQVCHFLCMSCTKQLPSSQPSLHLHSPTFLSNFLHKRSDKCVSHRYSYSTKILNCKTYNMISNKLLVDSFHRLHSHVILLNFLNTRVPCESYVVIF